MTTTLTIMEIVILANTQPTIRSMSIKQVHLKDFVSSVEFCKEVKFNEDRKDHKDK